MTADRPPDRAAGTAAAICVCAAVAALACAVGAAAWASPQEADEARPEVEIDRAALDALGPAAPVAAGRGADGLPLYDPRNGSPRSRAVGRFAEGAEAPASLRRPPPRVAAAEADAPPPRAPSIPGAMPERPSPVPPMPALPGDPALSMGSPAGLPPTSSPVPVADDDAPPEAVAAREEPEPAAETPPTAETPPEDAAVETPPAAMPPLPEPVAEEPPPARTVAAREEPEPVAETPPAAETPPEDASMETPPAALPPLPEPVAEEPPPARTAAAPPPVAETPPPASPSSYSAIGIVFASGDSELPGAAREILDGVAERLAADPAIRVVLKAYASAEGATASAARRLSLMRALAVRSYLMDAGIDATRIDVRALGAKYEAGPPDRVDIVGIA